MKTAISLPDDLFKAAESLAGQLGVSRSHLYATALDEYLGRHQSRRVTEQLNVVYATELALDVVSSHVAVKTLKRSLW